MQNIFDYVDLREDAPGKIADIKLEVQMAATVGNMVGSSEVSPMQPCRGLQASTTKF